MEGKIQFGSWFQRMWSIPRGVACLETLSLHHGPEMGEQCRKQSVIKCSYRPTTSNLLPPLRLHVLKFPQLPKTLLASGINHSDSDVMGTIIHSNRNIERVIFPLILPACHKPLSELRGSMEKEPQN